MLTLGIALHLLTIVVWLFTLRRLFRVLVFGAIKLPRDISFEDFYLASVFASGFITWSLPSTIWEWAALFIFNYSASIEDYFVAVSVSTFFHTLIGPFLCIQIGRYILSFHSATRGYVEPPILRVLRNKSIYATLVLSVILQILCSIITGAIKISELANLEIFLDQLYPALVDANLGFLSMYGFCSKVFDRISETWHLRQ